jgi:hypothetical protein
MDVRLSDGHDPLLLFVPHQLVSRPTILIDSVNLEDLRLTILGDSSFALSCSSVHVPGLLCGVVVQLSDDHCHIISTGYLHWLALRGR